MVVLGETAGVKKNAHLCRYITYNHAEEVDWTSWWVTLGHIGMY